MRRNLRLDWRALALLGALLSLIIDWPGLVFAMPLMASLPDSSTSTATSTANSTNNSNLFSNSYLQSDHSRSSLVPSAVSERSVNQPTNQSINAEFNQSLSTQLTAITSTPRFASEEDSDQLEEPLGFVISAVPNEHLAVLSRTERSIRHQNHQHQQQQQQQQKKHHHYTQNNHHHQHQQHQQQHQQSPADNNFIGSKSKRLSNPRSNLNINSSSSNTPISNLDRNERSTVPQSHLAWTSRKIQLYIKNRILQLMRDGTVNGTQDENSEFTILQRSTVDVGRIKLQSVATCLFLCMDACGVPYGSKDFTDDCVFNENMGLQNYNTYSSTYHSQARRVFYLALNGSGQPRRTQIPASRSLGKLSTYTNAITETVPQERVEQLIAKNFGANRVKHGVRQLCDTGKPLIELIDVAKFKGPPHCSSNTSGSSSSKSSSSSSYVPVSAISSLSSISNSSQSESGHISSSSNSNLSSSSSSSSSISNGNSSGSNSSSGSSTNKANKKKKHRCRQHEQEDTHNCQKRAGAGALRKLGPKAQRCKELREKAAAEKRAPPNCGKKNGARKTQEAAKGVQQRAKANIQQGGKKKLNKSGKQRQNGGKKQQHQQHQQQQHQQQQHQAKAVSGGKRKHRKMDPSFSTSTSTSTMATSLATPPASHWESSSPLPAFALSETSDRVERNVRTNSGEEEPDQNQDQEQADPTEQGEEEGDNDGGSLEDASYEDASSEAQGRSAAAAGDDSLYYDFGRLSPRR
ncbi:protein kinase 4 isoform X2 [Drosophila elegans]|uniref:protein kinase 4 isoform X2 n=1 Tax=Drosophila elegans TaxID=30023 RepID=UPI0007E62775|nr:protein kinase 4 isoform X2 [Drosophila elegans]